MNDQCRLDYMDMMDGLNNRCYCFYDDKSMWRNASVMLWEIELVLSRDRSDLTEECSVIRR